MYKNIIEDKYSTFLLGYNEEINKRMILEYINGLHLVTEELKRCFKLKDKFTKRLNRVRQKGLIGIFFTLFENEEQLQDKLYFIERRINTGQRVANGLTKQKDYVEKLTLAYEANKNNNIEEYRMLVDEIDIGIQELEQESKYTMWLIEQESY